MARQSVNRHEQLKNMLAHAASSDTPWVTHMKRTVENSPWHREASVWVHTEMVVGEFLKIWEESDYPETSWAMFCAGVAALFHDFGKPDAEEERTNAEGATYRRYAGHEAISATEFRLVATGDGWNSLFGESCPLKADDVFNIAYMIQHHLPYSYKDGLRNSVLQTAWYTSGGDYTPFTSLLRADARGRISDGHEQKLADVETWIANAVEAFTQPNAFHPGDGKYAYVLIGPSGCGKSSYLCNFGEDLEIFSMDAMRLELYGDESVVDPVAHYTAAWQAANEDEKNFRALVTARIHEVAKSDAKFVVADNTHCSKKARREFIAAAKQAGRVVIGVCFVSVGVEELIRRGKARGNRGIPNGTLVNMFRSLYLPGFDEVDVIHVV